MEKFWKNTEKLIKAVILVGRGEDKADGGEKQEWAFPRHNFLCIFFNNVNG